MWRGGVGRPLGSAENWTPPTATCVSRSAMGFAEGLLVVADHQTAGQGRLDRRGESPPGADLAGARSSCGLLCSASDLHLCTAAVALAARRCLRGGGWGRGPPQVAHRPAGRRAKLAGVLAEAEFAGGGRWPWWSRHRAERGLAGTSGAGGTCLDDLCGVAPGSPGLLGQPAGRPWRPRRPSRRRGPAGGGAGRRVPAPGAPRSGAGGAGRLGRGRHSKGWPQSFDDAGRARGRVSERTPAPGRPGGVVHLRRCAPRSRWGRGLTSPALCAFS